MTTSQAMADKQRVMSLLKAHPFSPPRWLQGGNRQSILKSLVRHQPSTGATLERWTTPDDDFLRLHIRQGSALKPVIIILHGLEGHARSEYVVGLSRAASKRDWTTVVMEQRSCGGELNRAQRMYHIGETTDLTFVVDSVIKRWPDRPLGVVGYSLGGNQVAKWCGELGESLPAEVVAAVAISPPVDLMASTEAMESALRGFYSRVFLRSLIPKAIAKERQHPGCLDVEAVKRVRTVYEFDDLVTSILHGFDGVKDYYQRNGCGQFLAGLGRPLLMISAIDDPFTPGASLPWDLAKHSEYLHGLFVPHGGHCGFVESLGWSVRDWGEQQALRFIEAYA